MQISVNLKMLAYLFYVHLKYFSFDSGLCTFSFIDQYYKHHNIWLVLKPPIGPWAHRSEIESQYDSKM